MYHLTDQQINFILNDIQSRGVTMESLQQDLLDHVCCIIERDLEANGDFEHFYSVTIKTFYKNDLREIEKETQSLLTNKNYYAMKKILIASGIISTALLTMGIVLKFLHQPGAAFGIVTGIVTFSFLFLPLLFLLKIQEKQQVRDKLLIGLGSLVGILISMAILFKIMHWPYANIMGITSVGILVLLYLPINLVTGIRNPDTKVNTIVSSVLLIAGCGLFLSLARSPQGSKENYIRSTAYFVRNEQLFQTEWKQFQRSTPEKMIADEQTTIGLQIISLSEELKSFIIQKETGYKLIDADFESKQAWLGETFSEIYFSQGTIAESKLLSLRQLLEQYNRAGTIFPSIRPVPISDYISGSGNERVLDVLNCLVQLENFILLNEQLKMDHV